MSTDGTQFVFLTCRRGAEGALKQEIARGESAWRLAYSRPGFLTFKLPAEQAVNARQLAERHWTFAHAHGLSLGRVTGTQLAPLVQQVWGLEGVQLCGNAAGLVDIHVWESATADDADLAGEVPSTPLCDEIEKALRAAAPESCVRLSRSRSNGRRPTARSGLVLDVVVLAPGEWCVGLHEAVTWPQRWPGGAMPIALPGHAVSRAYAKLEEALSWSGLPIATEDECVEIGCAPGGASQALLDHGLFVTGIDPAAVDPAVLAHPRFRHLKKRGKDVRRHEFLGVRWLVADMNIAPEVTLDEVEGIVTHPGVTVRGMILTLKLSEWSVAERLPEFTARVRSWGFRDVRVRQLVTGGQEVCLAALRRKELRRLGRAGGHALSRERRLPARRRKDRAHNAPSGPHF
jgi:23S rRNA (cytidine2498-2'-O)-methyltransferase